MILYDYECECGRQFQEMNTIENRLSCLCLCGRIAQQVITHSRNQDWFRPHWNEHFTPDGPVYVESRQHLKELCFKYGKYSRALGPIDDRRGS